MKKKRLILDMDDTLADLIPTWLNAYNKDYDDDLTTEDIKSWEIVKYVKPECGVKLFNYLEPSSDSKSLWSNMPPVEGAVETMNLLKDLTDIFIVSSVLNNYKICQHKHDWLLEHFPYLDPKKFYFIFDNSAVTGDFMVDDYYKNLESFPGMKLLFSRPHNKTIMTSSIGSGLQRVANWTEVYEKIVEGL